MVDVEPVKERVEAGIDRSAEEIVAVSRSIHAHPELMFEEVHAHATLTAALHGRGHAVVGYEGDLATAFRVDVGEGDGPLVAICCEYDALPDIGHACGHNIIAAAGLGAGLAAAEVADDCGGRLRILGTPAEEGGDGKGLLYDAGAFDDVDAVVMVHPGDVDRRFMTTLAASYVEATFHGKAAHAAASPWHGRNALDAAVAAYTNVGIMRQQLAPDQRVHGAFLEVPDRSNVIPERVVVRWVARGRTVTSAADAQAKLLPWVEAGAVAARCEVELDVGPIGSQVLDNGPMVDAYVANADRRGRRVDHPDDCGHIFGSTDLGKISRRIPSIHPVIGSAPPGIGIHEREFTDAAGSPMGDAAAVDAAAGLALTVVDLWCRPGLVDDAWAALRADCAADPHPELTPHPR